jgi:hypothetical protein
MIQREMGGLSAWVSVEIRCVPLYFQKKMLFKWDFATPYIPFCNISGILFIDLVCASF